MTFIPVSFVPSACDHHHYILVVQKALFLSQKYFLVIFFYLVRTLATQFHKISFMLWTSSASPSKGPVSAQIRPPINKAAGLTLINLSVGFCLALQLFPALSSSLSGHWPKYPSSLCQELSPFQAGCVWLWHTQSGVCFLYRAVVLAQITAVSLPYHNDF